MLDAELAREELPARVVLEAVGLAVRRHLLEAYGWFLLELAEADDLPSEPPLGMAGLRAGWSLKQPLRGELVELDQLERQGWLAELLAPPSTSQGGRRDGGADLLPLAEAGWSETQLRDWHDQLAELIDRMGHGLDEW